MKTNYSINQLVDKVDVTNFKELDYAKLFIWYLTDLQDIADCSMYSIVKCFRDVNLSTPNQTRLRTNLRKSKDVTVGHSYKSFKLHRNTLIQYRTKFSYLLIVDKSPEDVIREKLDVSDTPLLNDEEKNNAYNMAQVYVALHCLENSARKLIRFVLRKHIGEQWWNEVASSKMKQKLQLRKEKEAKNKWLQLRGSDELYYMDWDDLVSIMRKYPDKFEQHLGTIKFAELRLEELENLRNTIAHNGVLPEKEISRIQIYFSDWCKQVTI